MRIGTTTILLSLIRRDHLQYYLSKSFIPLRKRDDVLLVGVTDKFKSERFVSKLYKGKISFIEITEKSLVKMLQIKFSSYFLNSAVLKLHLSKPLFSSKSIYTFRFFILSLLVGAFAFFSFASKEDISLLINVSNIALIINTCFKFLMLKKQPTENEGSYSKVNLPIYSVLLPLYKETKSTLEGLINSINNMNYPKELLDVKVIVEQFDKETIRNLNNIKLPKYIHVICTKAGHPNTKPKACNYALNFVTGKYVVVYDAEDRPEANQLLKAVKAFQVSDKRVMCLQAKIGFYNRRENFLTAQMSLEYKIWFERFLKFLERRESAIPLGGSSNHFKVRELIKLKGWDPYNVTEDADLGVRVHKYRFKTKMLDSITMEEGPESLSSWLKQRSRWIKGHITTYCVHMRTMKAFISKRHPMSIVYFHLFLLMPTLSFLYPFFSIGVACFSDVELAEIAISSYISFCLWTIFCWYSSYILSEVFAFKKRLFLAFLSPVYYILHCVASVLAIVEFVICPSYWRKTSHFFRERENKKRLNIFSSLYSLLFN